MKFKEISIIGKIAIYLSAITVVSFAIAFGLFFTPGVLYAGGNIERSIEGRLNIDESEKVSTADVDSIKIITSSADVIVEPVSGGEVKAELKGYVFHRGITEDDLPILQVTEQSGKVDIRVQHKTGFNIGYQEINLTLTVQVPESFKGSLGIDTSSGDVQAVGLALEELRIDTSSGEAVLSSSSAGALNITTSSGDIEMDTVTADRIGAESSSGEFKGDFIQAGRFSREASSGDTRIRRFSGEFFSDSSSGSVTAEFAEFTMDIDITSSSGDIVVRLPASSEFEVAIETSSGDIECEWPITMTIGGKVKDNKLFGTVGDGGPLVKIEASSGDVEIFELSD